MDKKRKQQSSSNKILLYVKSHKICTLLFHTWHITFEFTGKLERNLQYGILRRRCLSCLWICKDRRDNQWSICPFCRVFFPHCSMNILIFSQLSISDTFSTLQWQFHQMPAKKAEQEMQHFELCFRISLLTQSCT